MEYRKNTILYIDAANLILTAKDYNLDFDYFLFLKYLKDKFKIDQCVYFTANFGFLKTEIRELEEFGVEIVYKNHYTENTKIKANCDVEISHRITKDIENNLPTKIVLLTGDGDFYSLLDYANNSEVAVQIVSIHPQKTSKLFKKNTQRFGLLFLAQVIEKVSKRKALARHDRLERVLFGKNSITRLKNMSIVSEYKRRQAEKILQNNNILEILGNFGEVRVGGSYFTDLMSISNDIDISVVSKDKRKASLEFIKYITENRLLQKFEYGDFEKFEREKRPKDFIVVLKIEEEGEKWEVEIWFKESFDKNVVELEERLLKIDRDTKLQILQEKFERDQLLDKHKLSSYEIYKKYLN